MIVDVWWKQAIAWECAFLRGHNHILHKNKNYVHFMKAEYADLYVIPSGLLFVAGLYFWTGCLITANINKYKGGFCWGHQGFSSNIHRVSPYLWVSVGHLSVIQSSDKSVSVTLHRREENRDDRWHNHL